MEKNNLYKRSFDFIKERRERILSGKINSIPWGFPRLETILPGIEQGTYYLISANTKVGKTQISDWLFVFNTIDQVMEKGLNIKLKIFYFTLEMSKEDKMLQAFSNILFVKEGIRVAPVDLKSTNSKKVLSKETLDVIEKYEPFFRKMEEIVIFVDNIRNPFGIYKFCRDYAQSNGVQHKKIVEFVNNKTGEIKKTEIDDYYEPNDPEEYVIVIVDHISLISQDSDGGRKLSLHESITKLSSDYLITLRNKYNYIPVVIQQQSAAQESLDNLKHNKLKPSLDGLGDNKLTARDADVIMGLFSPFRHEISEYLGYDIKFFKDNIRFLEIMGGRQGGGGTVTPLYFDGAVNYFKELPSPDNIKGMNNVKKFLNEIRKHQ